MQRAMCHETTVITKAEQTVLYLFIVQTKYIREKLHKALE